MCQNPRGYARFYQKALEQIDYLNASFVGPKRRAIARGTREQLKRKHDRLYRRRAIAETLEPRLLLASDFEYNASAETQGVDLRVTSNGDVIELYDQTTDSLIKSQLVADNSGFVTISGSIFDDALTIDDSMVDFDISFDGGTGVDSLLGPQLANDWRITAADKGTVKPQCKF